MSAKESCIAHGQDKGVPVDCLGCRLWFTGAATDGNIMLRASIVRDLTGIETVDAWGENGFVDGHGCKLCVDG